MRKISLTPEALAELNAESDEPIQAPPALKVLPPKMRHAVHEQVARTVFGPLMKPTLQQWLDMWTSHIAIKASWAADNFMRRARKHTRNA